MQRNKLLLFVFGSFLVMMFVGCKMSAENKSAKNEFVTHSDEREIYEWRIYTLKETGGNILDDFFQNTLIPAYNRQGISVGAFS